MNVAGIDVAEYRLCREARLLHEIELPVDGVGIAPPAVDRRPRMEHVVGRHIAVFCEESAPVRTLAVLWPAT